MNEIMTAEEGLTHNKSRRNALVPPRPDTPHPWVTLRVRPVAKSINAIPIIELPSPEEFIPLPLYPEKGELAKKEASKDSPKKEKKGPKAPTGSSASLPAINYDSPTERQSGCCSFYSLP